MRTKRKHLFALPKFLDEEQTRRANLLSAIILTLIIIAIVRSTLTALFLPEYLPTILKANGTLLAVLFILYLIMMARKINAACILFTIYQWLAIAWLTYQYGGVNLSAYGFFIFVVLSAGLLLGGRWSIGYAIASFLYGLLLLYLEHRGLISPFAESSINAFNIIAPSFITTAVMVYLYSREITKALVQARRRTARLTQEMSARKQIEKQLVQAQKMEAIGTLAGGIAHDFNNILSAIIGYTELSQMSLSEKNPVSDYLSKIMEAGKRAKDLVKQILTFSRQTEHELQPISMNIIVKEVLKLLRASLPINIEIKQKLQSNSLVMGDPTQIHQIVMNLCTNAGHAMMENGGSLELELSDVELDSNFVIRYPDVKPGSFLNLTVSDNGHGMTPEVLNQIFDPFFTTKKREEGTGMGLAVVHGIVKSYGGIIYAYSEPEMGSSFKVFLPAIESAVESLTAAKETTPKGTERILFIDDEPAIIEIGLQMLQSLGYQVTTRTSSVEALDLFRFNPDQFDMVITDMTMPQLTGDKLAEELIALRKDLPIIICTGFSHRMTEEKAKEMGIKGFLMKPIIRSELANKIRKIFDELN